MSEHDAIRARPTSLSGNSRAESAVTIAARSPWLVPLHGLVRGLRPVPLRSVARQRSRHPLGLGIRYIAKDSTYRVDFNVRLTDIRFSTFEQCKLLNGQPRELRRLVLGRRNWLFTWLDNGGKRTADILSIVATCIAHDVNPRAYLHKVVHAIVHGWPQAELRELLPDRMLVAHPELYVGDPDALPLPQAPPTRVLRRGAALTHP
jgi:hypothetical protein